MGPIEETLRKAKALIDTPEKWTQGEYARHANGNPIGVLEEKAACFCSLGALGRVLNDDLSCVLRNPARLLLADVMNDGVASFNDNNSHLEVMAAWDKAIALAAEQGA